MNDNYLIPANTKSGQLILGYFLITLVLLTMLPMNYTWQVIVVVAPGLLCAFLVIPVPNYHNILTIIIEAYTFFTGRRRYIWKGWCVKDVKDVQNNK